MQSLTSSIGQDLMTMMMKISTNDTNCHRPLHTSKQSLLQFFVIYNAMLK